MPWTRISGSGSKWRCPILMLSLRALLVAPPLQAIPQSIPGKYIFSSAATGVQLSPLTVKNQKYRAVFFSNSARHQSDPKHNIIIFSWKPRISASSILKCFCCLFLSMEKRVHMIMNCMAPCCSQTYWLKLAEDETVHVRRGIPANCPFARCQACFHRCFGLGAKRFPYLCLAIFHCIFFSRPAHSSRD